MHPGSSAAPVPTPARGEPNPFETMRYEPAAGALLRSGAHLARLARTCAFLGRPFAPAGVRAALAQACAAATSPLRVRLEVTPGGGLRIDTEPLPADPAPVFTFAAASASGDERAPLPSVALAFERIDERDPLRRHKTTARGPYDAGSAYARAHDLADVLFVNRLGALAEGAISNVFLVLDGEVVTPPVASGALPGILRGELLGTGQALERPLGIDDVDRAGAVFLGSALRGLRRVRVRHEPVHLLP